MALSNNTTSDISCEDKAAADLRFSPKLMFMYINVGSADTESVWATLLSGNGSKTTIDHQMAENQMPNYATSIVTFARTTSSV